MLTDERSGQSETAGTQPGGPRFTWWAVLLVLTVGLLAMLLIGWLLVGLRFGDDRADVDQTADRTQISSEPLDRSTASDQAQPSSTSVSTTNPPSTVGPGPDQDLLVDRYRSILAGNGLNGDSLSDEVVVTFGSTACVFAGGAEDLDQFGQFRDFVMGTVETELSDEELVVAIDAAVVVFCPLDAERLGLSVS